MRVLEPPNEELQNFVRTVFSAINNKIFQLLKYNLPPHFFNKITEKWEFLWYFNENLLFVYSKSEYTLGGIARKPRPILAERCSIDVTDLAHIFTVDRYM
jgi:hypothetical protein